LVNLPFGQINFSDLSFIRIFDEKIKDDELKWHFDEKDRTVTVLENTGWMFQFDNTLPQLLTGTIEIKAGTWHRVLKGHGILKVMIVEKDI
jgi:hypothetical protein